jgi:hypothetical protein
MANTVTASAAGYTGYEDEDEDGNEDDDEREDEAHQEENGGE